MMNRNDIIESYLELARKAQEVEYYWENSIATNDELDEANNAALGYYLENGITRQELTDHQDAKRNVIKCKNVDEALSAMQRIFG